MHSSHLHILWAVCLCLFSCSKPDEGEKFKEPEAPKTMDTTALKPKQRPPAAGTIDQGLPLAPKPDSSAAPKAEADSGEPKPDNLQVVNDREAEMAWEILNLPENEASSMAMTELARRWGKTDLDAAVEFAKSLPKEGEYRRAFYRGIGEKLAKENPEELLNTIGGVDGEKGLWWQDQWKVETAALRKVAKYDLERATSYFTETFHGKQLATTAYQFSLRIANEQSVESAWKFVEELENPTARGRAVEALSRVWMEQETESAATFIDGLKDPAVRSYAIRGMLSSIHDTNPSEAVAWTMAMEDETLRQEAVTFLSKRWKSPEGAVHLEELLKQPGLTDEEKAAINTALIREQ